MGDTGQIPFTKVGSKTGKYKLTRLYGIFFWNWPGGTADENQQLEKLS